MHDRAGQVGSSAQVRRFLAPGFQISTALSWDSACLSRLLTCTGQRLCGIWSQTGPPSCHGSSWRLDGPCFACLRPGGRYILPTWLLSFRSRERHSGRTTTMAFPARNSIFPNCSLKRHLFWSFAGCCWPLFVLRSSGPANKSRSRGSILALQWTAAPP